MAEVTVHVPGLTAVGRCAGGFAGDVKDAGKKLDGSGTGLPRAAGLASIGKLATVEDVWSAHLDSFRDDLDAVGDNLVATAQTYRGTDDVNTDLFGPVSVAMAHHFGVAIP